MSCLNCTCVACVFDRQSKEQRRCADPQCLRRLPANSRRHRKYCNHNCNERHLRAKAGYVRGAYTRREQEAAE